MKKKAKTNYYYESFPELCHYSVLCEEKILSFLQAFDPSKTEELKNEVHELEHQADDKKHEVEKKLLTEFMTPIDREDIFELLRLIDDIADGATAIGDSVFYWNHYIGTLNLPDSVIAIKAYAFFSSYIENLNLGAGLQTIGYAAFRSTTVLKSITLPNTLTSIGEEAFDSATKLTTVNYKGTTADWAKVTLGTNWHRNAAFTAITCSDGSVTL